MNTDLFHTKVFLLLRVGINQNIRTKSAKSNFRDLRGVVWEHSALETLLQTYDAENLLSHLPQDEFSVICCCLLQ